MQFISLAGVLRVLFGLLLLLTTGWFGFSHRSAWIIPLLGIVFTALYIAGKWYAWRSLPTIGSFGRALAQTYPIQTILATLIYLIGLGLGRLFSSRPVAETITSSDVHVASMLTIIGLVVSVLIHRLEDGKGPLAQSLSSTLHPSTENNPPMNNNADFVISPDKITPETLFSSYRGWIDYSHTVLTQISENDGEKTVRKPFAANDLSLSETERRVGFTLPERLRRLYKVKDGGSIKDVMVPKVSNPSPVYDDWKSAFGGYEEMHGLKQLRTVHDSILDFAYEDDEDAFPEGAKQMLILSQWYQHTTFLDYRKNGEPRVGIANFDDDDWEVNGLWFSDFDHFFSSLVKIDDDERYQQVEQPEITRHGPSASTPDQFWRYRGAADHGADESLWANVELKLRVSLPLELKPYLDAVNGGYPYFDIFQADSKNSAQPEELNPFPGGRLMGATHWVSLKGLSERLDFVYGFQPWADLWDQSEQLIIISASFDTALMLDYRGSSRPEMLYVRNLDDPNSYLRLGTVDEFLNGLRAYANPHWDATPIGDKRLSARSTSKEHFWLSGDSSGVSEKDIKSLEARLSLKIPTCLKEWVMIQNGGAVRYRYLPPIKPNVHGYMNPVPTAEDWVDVFPDGVSPIDRWQTLAKWQQTHGIELGEALCQRGASQYVKDEYGDPNKIIILAEGEGRLTLLDTSRDSNKENATLVQLVENANRWQETHRSPTFGAMGLAARKDETWNSISKSK